MFWKRKKDQSKQGHGTHGHDGAPATPDEELAIARQALDSGDPGHAMQHVAYALAADPDSAPARALLDRVIMTARDPLQLVSLDRPETHYSIAAVRAYILARRNRLSEALQLMDQIYHAVPGLPYFSWVLEWMGDTEMLVAVDPEVMTYLLLTLSYNTDQISEANGERLEALLPRLIRYHEAHPQAAMPAAMASRLFRQLGHMEEALALAQAAYEQEPTYQTAVILGSTYKQTDNLVEAAEMFRVASQLNPDDHAILLDLGDVLCELGDFESGLAAYQQVLRREPEHPWAKPSYLHFKHYVDPSGPWRAQLTRYAASHPGNERAGYLTSADLSYIAHLPAPEDATVHMLEKLIEAGAVKSELNLRLSALESPSARLAIELYQIEQTGTSQLVVQIAEIQEPDPRLPRCEVDFLLWRYRGTDPEPAVDQPSTSLQSTVARLAASPYHLGNWSRQSRDIAQRLEPSSLNDLLGVMLHPPRRPADAPIWVWLFRVQVAVALIIAHLNEDQDDAWGVSLRRRVLFSLARGPMDWTVSAAIIALMQVAREEPTTVPDIAQLYSELLDTLPETGGIPYLDALLTCALHLPSPPPELMVRVKSHYE